MFTTVLPHRFVQRNRKYMQERESWLFAAIYKFFMHSPSSRRKYLEKFTPTPPPSTQWVFTLKCTI